MKTTHKKESIIYNILSYVGSVIVAIVIFLFANVSMIHALTVLALVFTLSLCRFARHITDVQRELKELRLQNSEASK